MSGTPDATGDEGERLDVDYTVQNTGGSTDTQDITLVINSTQEDIDTGITLDGSETHSGTLSWQTQDGDAGTYGLDVNSDDDTESRTIEVETAIPDSVTSRLRMDEGSGSTLNDSVGSVTSSLVSGSWVSASKYTGGFATDYDGANSYWATDSEIDINGQSQGVAGWFEITGGDDRGDAFNARTGTGSDARGWELQVRTDGEVRQVHYDSSGSASIVCSSTDDAVTLSLDGTDYFIAITVDGDMANLYIWDSSQQLVNTSGTGARAQTTSQPFEGMRNGAEGLYLAGQNDDPHWSVDAAIPESDYQSIYEGTLR